VCKLYLAALIIWATNSPFQSEQNLFCSCDICAREIWNKSYKWVIPWRSARTFPWCFLLAKCHVTRINVFYFSPVRKVRPFLHRSLLMSPMLSSTCADLMFLVSSKSDNKFGKYGWSFYAGGFLFTAASRRAWYHPTEGRWGIFSLGQSCWDVKLTPSSLPNA